MTEIILAHSEITNKIYALIGKEKVDITEQAIAEVKAIQALSQEPCTDAVSREAIDKYIARLLSGYLYDGERERLEIFSAYLWELPSVNPQPCDDVISQKENSL